MGTRITFGAELGYAMHVRGLSLSEVARLSGVAAATASSAAHGRPVNVSTALRVARAVAARPIIPELLEWVERPDPLQLRHAEPASAPVPPSPHPDAPVSVRPERTAATRARRPGKNGPGQLRIAAD